MHLPPAPHLGEHLLHVESGAHAQSAEAPPYVGRLGYVVLFRPVGVAIYTYQRNIIAEKMASRQRRPIPTHGDHQVHLSHRKWKKRGLEGGEGAREGGREGGHAPGVSSARRKHFFMVCL